MIYSFKEHKPVIAEDVFIAPGSYVIGRVWIGSGSSIWFNCVLRGDVADIKIGCYTNIQDGCILHGASVPVEIGVELGDNVTVGHNAILHACRIESGAFIGMGAIILNGAQIGEGALIGAGSLVQERMVIPPGMLAVGVPAKVVRKIKDEEREYFIKVCSDYRERARIYRQLIFGDYLK